MQGNGGANGSAWMPQVTVRLVASGSRGGVRLTTDPVNQRFPTVAIALNVEALAPPVGGRVADAPVLGVVAGTRLGPIAGIRGRRSPLLRRSR